MRDEAALALAYLSTKDATMAATIVESVSSKSKNFELTETLTAAIDSAVWLKEPMAAGSSAGTYPFIYSHLNPRYTHSSLYLLCTCIP